MPPGYDGTSASPDFANGAETGAFAYLFSGAAQSAANGQNPLDGLVDLAGKIWELPNTLLGLTAGVASLPFGSDISFEHNAIVFNNFPWGPGGALTLGNTILSTEPQLTPNMIPTYMARYDYLSGLPLPANPYVDLGGHEEAHTYQASVLGPLFIPVYGLQSLFSSGPSPLENAADKYGQTGKGWWPW